MSIKSEIDRIKGAIASSYIKVAEMGGSAASAKVADLSAAIGTIPGPKPEQKKPVTLTGNGVSTITPDNGHVLSSVTVTVAVPDWKGGVF